MIRAFSAFHPCLLKYLEVVFFKHYIYLIALFSAHKNIQKCRRNITAGVMVFDCHWDNCGPECTRPIKPSKNAIYYGT
jgi:hypothetical protein